MALALPMPGGFVLHHSPRLDSTSLAAWRELESGKLASGSWLLADEQSRGHGRRGAAWASPLGNLYASLVLRLDLKAAHCGQLAILSAMAALDALDQLAPGDLSLGDLCVKWPNDILLAGGKLGGILLESRPAGDGQGKAGAINVVIGFGLNILSSPAPAPAPAEQGAILFPPTHLHEHGWSCSRDELFVALARAMRDWLAIWREGENFSAPRLAWMERSCHMGRIVKIDVGGERVEGRMAGIDAFGALELAMDDGGRLVIHSGHMLAVE